MQTKYKNVGFIYQPFVKQKSVKGIFHASTTRLDVSKLILNFADG